MYKQKINLNHHLLMKRNKNYLLISIAILFLLALIGIRFSSYMTSDIPLWYDHGIYRTFFMMLENQLPYIQLWQLPMRIKETYEPFSGLFYITSQSILWINADNFLLRWVAVLHIIVSIFIYLLLKKYNKTTALIWVLLYITSIVQYQVFRRGYIKQMMGVLFIITAYYLIEKKSYRLLIPILIWLFTSNRAGWIFFLLSFVIYKIVIYIKHKSWTYKDILTVLIAWVWSIIIYRPILQEQVFAMFGPMFGQIFIWDKSGTFFDKSQYFVYNIILLSLSILWLIIWISKNTFKKIPIEIIWFAIGILRVGLQLFFYNRMLGYLDIFVIIFAAYGLSYLLQSPKKIWKYIGISIYVLQLIFFARYVDRTNFPLVIEKEFETIKQIPTMISSDAKIMVTGRKYSAFMMWYASYDTIAPWLFDLDTWTEDQWKLRHLSDWNIKCNLLYALWEANRPDYLWVWSLQPFEQLSWATCLKKLLWDDSYWFYLINYPNAQS